MREIAALLIFLFFSFPAFTQERDYAVVDWSTQFIPDAFEHSVEDLALFLDSPRYGEFEKFRAAFIWVASNISYDHERRNKINSKTSNIRRVNNNETLKLRKGVCGDYAALLHAILDKMGVNSRVVKGYAKGAGYEINDPFFETNHAWNAVQLEGKWYFTDVTWASPSKADEDLELFYFLPEVEKLRTSHLPEKEEYRDKYPFFSMMEFMGLPRFFSPYFELGCTDVIKKNNTIVSNELELTFNTPYDLSFKVTSVVGPNQQHCKFTAKKSENKDITLSITPPVSGKQKILVFGKLNSASKYECMLELIITKEEIR
ncbi:MAG: transglutaminase domain-containing protein [Bacteroidota bacterium]